MITNIRKLAFSKILQNSIPSYVEEVIVVLPLIVHAGIFYEIPQILHPHSYQMTYNILQQPTSYGCTQSYNQFNVYLKVLTNSSLMRRAKTEGYSQSIRWQLHICHPLLLACNGKGQGANHMELEENFHESERFLHHMVGFIQIPTLEKV